MTFENQLFQGFTKSIILQVFEFFTTNTCSHGLTRFCGLYSL